MKKWCSVMFLVLGLFVAMTFTKSQFAFAAYTPGSDGFWESFDTRTTGNFTNGDGWTNYNYYGGIASIVEDPSASNKSLKLVDNDFDSIPANQYRFGAYVLKEGFGNLSGKVVFETKYKVKKIDGYTPSYNIELFGGTQKAARFLQFSSGNYGIKTLSEADNYSIPGGTAGSPLPIDEWVTLKMTIDTAAKTYDLIVQSDSLKNYNGLVDSQATLDTATGTFQKKGVPLFSTFTGTEITKVQIYSNFNKGEMFFDYIALYEQSAQPEATISAPAEVNALGEFNVDVGLNNANNTKAEDITVLYDANLFDYIGAEGMASGNSSTVVNAVYHNAPTGNLRIITSNPGEGNVINGEASIARLTFKAKNVPGSGQIEITNATVSDASGIETVIETLSTATVTVIENSALLELISSSTTLYNSAEEGIINGAFIPGMLNGLKAQLQQAISSAQIVADNSNATSQEKEAAINQLTNARNLFESKRITAATGDINQSQNISIGDLGLTVGYYGKTSSDSDWAVAKIADINEDGIVDSKDLLFISQRITLVD